MTCYSSVWKQTVEGDRDPHRLGTTGVEENCLVGLRGIYICTVVFVPNVNLPSPLFVLKESAIPFTIGRFTPSIWASVRIGSCIDTLLLVHLMGVLSVLMGPVRTSRRWLAISTVGIVTAAATSSAST